MSAQAAGSADALRGASPSQGEATPPCADPPRLARLLAALTARLGGEEGTGIAAFARTLFTRGGEVYLAQLGEDAAVALATHAFRMLAEGGPVPRVRAFTPTFAIDGWEGGGAVIETAMSDRPFIVDTIREYLHSEGVEVRHLLHPLLATEREETGSERVQGRLRAQRAFEEGTRHESFLHVVIEPVPPERLAALEAGVAERLADLLLVTDDFRAMLDRTEAVAVELDAYKGRSPTWDDDVHEVQDFLRWLARGGLVFLGYRSLALAEQESTLVLAIDRGSGLGLLRKEERSHYATPTPVASIPEPYRGRILGGPLLVVTRTTASSPVHRSAPMDYVGVKRLDAGGRVVGEHRFLGLFTSRAYAEESAEVPILRRRLQRILQAERAVPGSHDHREIVAIFNSMPKAELFAVPVEALRADIRTIIASQRTSDVHVTFRRDALERGVAVMVILPRDKFSAALRARIQDALAARFDGKVLDYHLALGEGDQARLHFLLAAPRARVLGVRWEELQQEIAELTRGWDDRLAERLAALHGEENGAALAERYARVLPEEYKAATEIAAAVNDVRHLETLGGGAPLAVDVHNPLGGRAQGCTAVKLYLRAQQLILSDVMPVLENLGLRVFAEDAIAIPSLDGTPVSVSTFSVQDESGRQLDIRRHGPRLTAALLRLHAGAVEDDALNRLVLSAGLAWQEVDLLRTYCNYAFQTGLAPSRRALSEGLTRHPDSAALLWRCFAARFEPAADRTRAPAARDAFLASLDAVTSIGEDRVLRTLLVLVEATVRTNYYTVLAAGGDSVAIKLDCARIESLPKPRPLYEIYVHSPAMEGVHLRAGRIARGGIRASDRHDDFRAEILGLIRTQTVKNAVIVPVGAKGGFIVKRGDGRPEAAREAYATLIRGMLDLTDTITADVVVSPAGLVCHDGPDPYLVVAADKGTAAFSDLANGIAAEYGFWLGDAFASGGSHGYDHKKLGITARGAWECIALHFRELDGRDVHRDSITLTGIGDMSGDVFGNGLLLSRAVKLRAAFDHRHVFLDPDPDPERAFAERARLAALPRSSWADYDPEALSAGGAIVPRGAKAVTLSPQACAMLGVPSPILDSDSLIRAVLCMETDLLFNGGIGTYVKAAGETHAEAGDSANTAVRVNASEIRARVVAEGGNLGFTQRARIEYALGGGRINTDAIDNSAGVDMSDHEVNLKIALQPLVDRGELAPAQRNRILEELADDVAALVLEHNRSQSRTLSRDQRRSATRIDEFRETMAQLESEGLLDRALEALPDRETLRARRATFLGLTRPELAVLLAFAKMHCARAVEAGGLWNDPYLEGALLSYFPRALAARFPEAIRTHRLRRELVATTLANAVVDLMGATFVVRTARDTGAAPAEVVRAFVVVEALTEARALAARAVAASPDAATCCLDALVAALERAIRWLVETAPALGPVAPLLERFRGPVAAVLAALPGAEEAHLRAHAGALAAAGVGTELADACARAEWLREALDVVRVAEEAGVEPLTAARAYWGVTDVFDFAWLRQCLERVPAGDRWERRATEGLGAELDRLRRALACRLLRTEGADMAARVGAFRARHAGALERLRLLVDDLRSARSISLAAALVAVRELARLEGSE